jgi:hypothetical protein
MPTACILLTNGVPSSEMHKTLVVIAEQQTAIAPQRLAETYLDAKEYVIAEGYAYELDQQAALLGRPLRESDFLREAAWVILSSGFRESSVRRLFPSITTSFHGWSSANFIAPRISECRRNALRVFAHAKKINAICTIIITVNNVGFRMVRESIRDEGLQYLMRFPFVGPVTGLHLLKNIGFDVAKPDRHLSNIARCTGYSSVSELCLTIHAATGDDVSEIDTVLWRYATIKPGYLNTFHP